MSNVLACGDVATLPGLVALLSHQGNWTLQEMGEATVWEIYTAAATDMQGADVLVSNGGRQTPVTTRYRFGWQGCQPVAALTSAKVANSTYAGEYKALAGHVLFMVCPLCVVVDMSPLLSNCFTAHMVLLCTVTNFSCG